ncbi:MAG: hypothetical protein C3F13_13195 [Anaerolineales bacterium]|nr:hypothetical protein [Anaerolineae bacterium]PWB51394.1 MAG: hypothetical protein C3F13_13195 [Anaerolineales bacterium]
MVRIGFDPGLEAEQQHRELIKQSEYYRLLQTGSPALRGRPSNHLRILAQLGTRLAMFGSALEERYGQPSELLPRENPAGMDDGIS